MKGPVRESRNYSVQVRGPVREMTQLLLFWKKEFGEACIDSYKLERLHLRLKAQNRVREYLLLCVLRVLV